MKQRDALNLVIFSLAVMLALFTFMHNRLMNTAVETKTHDSLIPFGSKITQIEYRSKRHVMDQQLSSLWQKYELFPLIKCSPSDFSSSSNVFITLDNTIKLQFSIQQPTKPLISRQPIEENTNKQIILVKRQDADSCLTFTARELAIYFPFI